MNTIAGFLDRLTVTQKAVTALAGAMTLGFTVAGLVFGGQIEANAQTTADHTASIARLFANDAALARGDSTILARLERTNCLLMLSALERADIANNPVLLQRACP